MWDTNGTPNLVESTRKKNQTGKDHRDSQVCEFIEKFPEAEYN